VKVSEKYGVCIGSAVPIQLVFLCLAFNASSRGDHFVALPFWFDFVFPYYFVVVGCVSWSSDVLILLSFAIIFLLQWLIYGWIIGFGWVRGRFWRYFFAVFIAHVVSAIAGSWFYVK
jgi:hypothetical protein